MLDVRGVLTVLVLKVLVLKMLVLKVLVLKVLVLVVLTSVLVLAGCAPGPVRVMPGSVTRGAPMTLRVQVREGTALVVRQVPLEEYVAAAALSEVHPAAGPSADPGAKANNDALASRIFEVQAVIARTYAVSNRGRHGHDGFDLCSTTHCQLYEPVRLQGSRWGAVVHDAVRRTSGDLLWFAGTPARAVFHADCGGHTSNAAAVWGGVAPAYLSGRRDDDAADGAHTEWNYEVTRDALRIALNSDARTAVGAKLDTVEIAGRDAAGRAEQIVLRGTRTFIVRGEVFREVVTRRLGVKTLRSTLFSVKKSGGGFAFSGRGFGHGVGLCQAGAIARLRGGASPEKVLAHYFPGTSLRRSGIQ